MLDADLTTGRARRGERSAGVGATVARPRFRAISQQVAQERDLCKMMNHFPTLPPHDGREWNGWVETAWHLAVTDLQEAFLVHVGDPFSPPAE